VRVAFILHQTGPYHHARFNVLGDASDLHVIEIKPNSKEYDWDLLVNNKKTQKYKTHQLFKNKDLNSLLNNLNPGGVVITGWSEKEYFNALLWCKKKNIPALGISDSTYRDEKRVWWKEWIKSKMIAPYDAFLVAGSRSRAYLEKLNFPDVRIFQPWDVVDNVYFRQWPEHNDLDVFKKSHQLPDKYWLCISRFISKKNHIGLLSAYAKFIEKVPDGPKLLLLGSGPLENEIRGQIVELKLGSYVEIRGFVQINELPGFYFHAEGLILPSKSDTWGLVINEAMACNIPVLVSHNCGCVDDLIKNGLNGMVFNHDEKDALFDALIAFNQTPFEKIKSVNQTILSKFSLRTFADAVKRAFESNARNPLGILALILLKMASR